MVSLCAKKIGSGKDVERKADLFASFFLMPADELEKRSSDLASKNGDNKLTIYDIIRIEQYFGVSHQAAVIRLKDSPYLSQRLVDEYLNSSVRYKAEMMGYDSELYFPLPEEKQYKTYGLYIDQANRLFQNELISDGKYEELLLDAFRTDLVYGGEEGGDVID